MSNGLIFGLRVLDPAARGAYSRVTEFLARIAQQDLIDRTSLNALEERWAEVLHDITEGDYAAVESRANRIYADLVALLQGREPERRVA